MILNIKSLLVVLIMIGTAHFVFRRWIGDAVLPEATQRHLSVGWAAISAFAFLLPDFWLFILASMAYLLWLGKRLHPLVMLCGLLHVVPHLERQIAGIGGINGLINFSYARLLALCCLFWWALSWRHAKHNITPKASGFDTVIWVYAMFTLVLQLTGDNLTNSLRVFVTTLIDMVLVYWAARRWSREQDTLRTALGALCYSTMIIGLIAFFEFAKGWLMYSGLMDSLHAAGTSGAYLLRGDTGMIRAIASTGHSLSLGYVAMVAILLWTGLSVTLDLPMKARMVGFGMLGMASVASLSRGPWVSLVAGLVVWFALSPGGLRQLVGVAFVALIAFGVALLTPARDTIISLIPWVGNTDSGNIDYRERLIEVSMILIRQNLWFGSATFLQAPIMQQMIQGQGIIDMVNSYLAITLSSGLMGLGLFVTGALGPVIHTACRLMVSPATDTKAGGAHTAHLQRGLVAAGVGSAIAIATVSSIGPIPWTYWLLSGLLVSLASSNSPKALPSG